MIPISVVMPVYNTEVLLLKEAVDSILNQTFHEFEFIIIDDGSNDETKSFLTSLTDPRIKLIRNATNIGITKSLNMGFRLASGKYIARMDGDDISLPNRFERQYAFMEANPDTIVCGSSIGLIGDRTGACLHWEKDMDYYRIVLLFYNPGPMHPTAFFNHEMLVRHNILYDETLFYAQDYGMWTEVSRFGNVCILDDVLLYYRYHSSNISIAHREKQRECRRLVQKELLTELMGPITDDEFEIHYHHCLNYFPNAVMTPEILKWYQRLLKANKEKHIYNQSKLKRKIDRYKEIQIQNMCKNEKFISKKAYLYIRYHAAVPTLIRKLKVKLLKYKCVSFLKTVIKQKRVSCP